MIEYLLSDSQAAALTIECEFGMGSIALVRCSGQLDAASLTQLLTAIRNARGQEYRILIFDFTYCSYENAVLTGLFSELAALELTAVTVNAIRRLAESWNCPLPEAFRRLNLAPQPNEELPDTGKEPSAISQFAPAVDSENPQPTASLATDPLIAGAAEELPHHS